MSTRTSADGNTHDIDVRMTAAFLLRHKRVTYDQAHPLLWQVGDAVTMRTYDKQVFQGVVVAVDRPAHTATIKVVPL